MGSVDSILKRMVAGGWKPGRPADATAVAAMEREFDVTLPDDYRAYLMTAGGSEATAPQAYTGLWSVRLVSIFNRRYRIPWNFPGLLGIGNDGFLMYVFDYRPEIGPVVASLGLSSSVWEDVVTETDTFTEWLERRLP